jgi:hypothetical protein
MLLYESLTPVCLNKLFETSEMHGTMSLSRSHALCLCLRLCACLAHSQHGMFKSTLMLVIERDALLKVSQRSSCDAAGLFIFSTQKDTAVWGRCTCVCLGD